MAELSKDPENDPGITFTNAALTKMQESGGEAASYRLKVERTDKGYKNWLHWDDEEEKDDEVIVLQEEGTKKQIKILIDPESFGFFESGELVIDFRKGLLMKEFTFENKHVGIIHVCGEEYKLRG
jgi:Fe-S cluster assembly iron-binding protein IscA